MSEKRKGELDTQLQVHSTGPKRALILILLGLAAASLTFIIIHIARDTAAERDVLIALQSTNQFGVVTPEGIEMLRGVDQRAIPALLRWSAGRDPGWYRWVNPMCRWINKPPLRTDIWDRKEMARKGFAILRERATAAVPELQSRVADTNRTVRRIGVQMLAAIGPSMGTNAFHQMTNCLADSEPNVRNDVVWGMQFHHPEDYPLGTLLAVYSSGLQDSYRTARQNAMIGLTRLGKKAAPLRTRIEWALSDSDPGVKSMATSLLREFETNTTNGNQ